MAIDGVNNTNLNVKVGNTVFQPDNKSENSFLPLVIGDTDPISTEDRLKKAQNDKKILEDERKTLENNLANLPENSPERQTVENRLFDLGVQIRALENEINICNTIFKAEAIIGNIQSGKDSEHFNKHYNMSIDQNTGNIIITLKKKRAIINIRKDYSIQNLRDIKDVNSQKTLNGYRNETLFGSSPDNDDLIIIPKDGTLVIPTNKCHLIE